MWGLLVIFKGFRLFNRLKIGRDSAHEKEPESPILWRNRHSAKSTTYAGRRWVSLRDRRAMIDPAKSDVSVRRQCALLALARFRWEHLRKQRQ